MGKKKRKISERQMELNSYYASEIWKVLSKPMPNKSGTEKSDISYAEAESILKHTIHQIKVRARIQF